MNCAVGSLLINSTDVVTTTISVSGLAFTPTALIFWWNGNTSATDAVGGADHRLGFGAAVSTTGRWAISSFSDDGIGTMVTATTQTPNGCVVSTNTAGSAIDGRADFAAWQSGGFDLVIDVQFPVSLRVNYLALDPTSAATGTFTEPGTAGDVDITGLAFQPELVVVGFGGAAAADEAVAPDSRLTFGAACSSSAQGTWCGGSNDASAVAVTRAYCTDTQLVACSSGDMLSLSTQGTLATMLPDGFRVSCSVVTGASRVLHFLAMAGNGQYAVAGGTTQTDTTTPITMPGSAGIDTVTGGFVVSHCRAESATGTQDVTQECSIGAFSSASARLALGMIDEADASSGSGVAEVAIAAEFDAVYANISTSDAIEGLMDVADMTAKTYIMDDADPSAFFFWNILFGTAGAPPAAVATEGWDQLLSNRRNRLVRTG